MRSLQNDDPRGPPPPAEPGRAQDRVRVRELLGAALRRCRVPPDGGADAVASGARATRGGVGELSDSDRARVLHGVEHRRLRRRPVPESGRRDRERAALLLLEPDGRAQSDPGRPRARHRGADRQPAVRAPAYAIAPIDRCYALTGTIKVNWEGISGGPRVQEAVSGFFEELQAQAVRHERAARHRGRGPLDGARRPRPTGPSPSSRFWELVRCATRRRRC